MLKIKIRRAINKDLPRIYSIEKRSYTPQLQATHKVLEHRLNTFGIWVAEVNNNVVGFFTCIPTKLNWPNPNIKKILKNRKPYYLPWLKEYKRSKKFDTLFVTSTAVESKNQNKGIGTALIKYSLKLAKELGLKYRASALRCEYKKYYSKTHRSIFDYINKLESKEIKDRFISLYLKLGFKLYKPIRNYEYHKGSLNYNIFAYKKL